MHNYNERLIAFVGAHSGLFTAPEIASIWKRNKVDVVVSAAELVFWGVLKSKCGVLHAE